MFDSFFKAMSTITAGAVGEKQMSQESIKRKVR